MKLSKTVAVLSWTAIALHILAPFLQGGFSSTSDGGSDDVLVAVLLLSAPLVPYLICLFVSRKVANPVVVLPPLMLAICVDVTTYIDVFVLSESSTAALGLVVAPLLNLIIALPLGFLMGWLLSRFGPFRTRRSKT